VDAEDTAGTWLYVALVNVRLMLDIHRGKDVGSTDVGALTLEEGEVGCGMYDAATAKGCIKWSDGMPQVDIC
jgi:hypothetical protein